MARFYGEVGYGETEETAPGVWSDVIVRRPYYGDITRNSRSLREGEHLNNDISVSNMISIVADAYAQDHFHAIRFVDWSGASWTVTEVEVQSPRLNLRLGGVYNGPTGSVAVSP